jgi:hypothetical protein
LGPFGTEATNRPIVPAPADYDDVEISGMMVGMGHRNTPEKKCPSAVLSNPLAARKRTRAAVVGSQRITA